MSLLVAVLAETFKGLMALATFTFRFTVPLSIEGQILLRPLRLMVSSDFPPFLAEELLNFLQRNWSWRNQR
jgi:hypothetical protein